MNKIYDKLFLAIAILFLSAGIFLYLDNSGQGSAAYSSIDVELANNPYQDETIPSAQSQESSWPEPVAQSAGPEWIYDVFTPPEIYIDSEGKFVPTGWKLAPPPTPFGIYLSEIVLKPYRIQLEGYIEEDRSDPSKSLLLLFDEEAQKQVRVRPSSGSIDSEFEVVSFSISRLRDTDGNIKIDAKASILDNRTDQEVLLTHGERLYQEDVTVQIRSDENLDFKKELTEVPTTFKSLTAEYILREINLEESTVLVEKLASEDEKSETRILEVRSTDLKPNSSSTSEPISKEEQEGEFDFMF